MFTYLHAITQFHPLVKFTCNGDPSVYENYVSVGVEPLPSKQVLDQNIRSMIELEVWRLIQDERTRRQNGGVFIPGINKWFHSDQTSRIQQIGLILWGQNMPTGIMWKTMDGTFIEMTPQLALSVFMSVAQLDLQAFSVAEQHRAQMIQSSDPLLYNFSSGWPAIYEV